MKWPLSIRNNGTAATLGHYRSESFTRPSRITVELVTDRCFMKPERHKEIEELYHACL